MKLLFTILLIITAVLHVSAQSTQYDTLMYMQTYFPANFYFHKPWDYDIDPTPRPLIIFFPGYGESTGPVTNLNTYGPSYLMNTGNKMTFLVNGDSVKPLVVSFQTGQYPGSDFVDDAITILKTVLRVDSNRIYLTGLSMGGQTIENYLGSSLAHSNRIAAVAVMHVEAPDGDNSNQMGNRFARSGGKWWGIEGQDDIRGMTTVRDTMNHVVSGSAKYTLITSGNTGSTHCCWNTFYDPAYTVGGENIYQFLLKQTKLVPVPTITRKIKYYIKAKE